MIPHVEQYIPVSDLELFAQIRQVVVDMIDPDLGIDEDGETIVMSCHMLARALAKIFPVSVRDGYFAGGYEHSWLETAERNLIDPYPVAVIGGPIMFDGNIASPSRQIYRKCSARSISYGRFARGSFRRSVGRIERALRDATKANSISVA